MYMHYPLQIDSSGRTANANEQDYIYQLIEQVLFTVPGERVNQHDFGSGVMQMVFAANNHELLATSSFLIKAALEKWLGHLIQVEDVQVKAIEAILQITVIYRINITQVQQIAEFNSPASLSHT